MMSTIAATNEGSAAEIAVTTSTEVSISPGLRPPITPRPTPSTMIRIEE